MNLTIYQSSTDHLDACPECGGRFNFRKPANVTRQLAGHASFLDYYACVCDLPDEDYDDSAGFRELAEQDFAGDAA